MPTQLAKLVISQCTSPPRILSIQFPINFIPDFENIQKSSRKLICRHSNQLK
jgi:hypothetical protein